MGECEISEQLGVLNGYEVLFKLLGGVVRKCLFSWILSDGRAHDGALKERIWKESPDSNRSHGRCYCLNTRYLCP